MKEREIATAIGNELKKHGFYMKIPDSFGGGKGFRFTPIKNFDAFFIKDGKFMAIEYKMEKGISFSFDSIRDVQVESLLEVKKNGGSTCIAIYVEREKKVILWNIEDFVRLKEYAISIGRKSISIIPAEKSWPVMIKERGQDWPIHIMLERMYGRQDSDERRSECSVYKGPKRNRRPRKINKPIGSKNVVPSVHGVRDGNGTSSIIPKE